MSLLQVEQLRRSFGGVRAVDGVSFALAAGEVAALIGPNGAGKSTLFNLIDGQLAPDQGRVLFNGDSLTAWSTAERTRRGIGRTFQVAQTFATLTVLQNVQLALVAAAGGALGITRMLWDLQSGGGECAVGASWAAATMQPMPRPAWRTATSSALSLRLRWQQNRGCC